MQRTAPSVPLTCFALVSATLLAAGCAKAPVFQPVTPGCLGNCPPPPSCTGDCHPDRVFGLRDAGLKPGASVTFSATVYNSNDTVNNQGVTWTVEEGPAGGTITDRGLEGGLYTAPAVEGVYHVIATSKAKSSLSATATVAVTATEFTLVGSMSTSRYYHTASLLPDGQVFVAGGMNDDYDSANPAELFDPATGKFNDAGQVNRIQHSATVLTNGDVLLAGGMGTSNAADLRKAGSGVIQPTGSMISSRSNHSATLLQDGRVLLAGGSTASGVNGSSKPTQTAELYDPATGTFTSVGNMTAPRSGHSAALLPNGRVLIVGGAAGAELYDPTLKTFLPAPGVSANRCYAAATLLADGRVLISGGADCSNTLLDTAEIYDPSTGQSTPTGKLLVAQAFNTATLLTDGRVLLMGGSPSVVSQIYDATTGLFTFGPHTTLARSGHTATLLPDGSVLIVGGSDSQDAELYK